MSGARRRAPTTGRLPARGFPSRRTPRPHSAASNAKPGNGPHPKMRHGDNGISAAAPANVTMAGTAMLPVPRMTLASELKIHTRIAHENMTFE